MPSNTLDIPELTEPIILNPVESYFWRLEKDLRRECRVAVLLRMDGCIEARVLSAALLQLQRRHPKLRAIIAEGSDRRLSYRFEPAPPAIPFEIRDYAEGETPWREEVCRLLQTDFPAAGPLAAVSVLRSRPHDRCELLLTLPHAIADGASAITLADDLLTEYARAEAQSDLPPCPSLPALTRARFKASAWRGRLWLLRRFVRLQREERRSRLTRLPEADGIPPHSQWVHWVFSREDTLALVRRCRKEQTSLSAVLVAAACCGLMDCLPVHEALFKWQLPFNVREELEGACGPVTSRELGCFITNMNGLLRLKQEHDFWDLARQTHHEIEFFILQGGRSFGYQVPALAYTVREWMIRFFAQRAPKPLVSGDRRVTLLPTHYGVLNMRDEYGSLRPRECTLTFNKDVTGPSLVMESLVMGQRLNLGFAAHRLEPAFWDQLQIAVRKYLEAAAHASAITPLRNMQAQGSERA